MIDIAPKSQDLDATQQQPTTASSKVHLAWRAQPPFLDQDYWDAKKKIIELEQHLLRWLGFDTLVPSPHRAVILVVQRVHATEPNQVIWQALKRVNNAIFSVDCLQQNVMALACAAVALEIQELHESDPIGVADIPLNEFGLSATQFEASKCALERVTQKLLSYNADI
jgi:hypothetical protein